MCSGLSPSVRGFAIAYSSGVKFRKDSFFATYHNCLEILPSNFLLLPENFVKSSTILKTFLLPTWLHLLSLGFILQLRTFHPYLPCTRKKFLIHNALFLLLMDGALNKAMESMALEEDIPINLPEESSFSSMEQSSRSLVGRLLNPACQNMARMLRTMPRIWKIYERVRGVVLTNESFQFIFELEFDIQTVMKHNFWVFDEWGMVLDRWVKNPPSNFLRTAELWIRLFKLPVNYFTLGTMRAVADGIGFCKEIEFDSAKPHLQNYVRARVVIDVD